MALLAITLSTCVFFIGSLATSCVDDEVAMFQSKVHLHRDEELASFKQYLSDLESKPLFMQVQILTKWAGYLPKLEAWDKTVTEFHANMSKVDAISDWVQTYSGNGTNVDALHTAAEIIHVVSQMPLDQFGLDRFVQSAQSMSAMIGTADKLVNGLDEMSDAIKWMQANSTLSWMDQILDQWSVDNDLFPEEVKLMEEALKRILDKVILPLNVKMDILKVPFAALRVHQHTITALQFVKPRFEEAFNELDTTKALNQVAKAEAAVDDLKVAIEVVKEMTIPIQHHQELVEAASAASQVVRQKQADEDKAQAAVEAARRDMSNAEQLAKKAAQQQQAAANLAHQTALQAAAAAQEADDLVKADAKQIEVHRKEMAEQNKTLRDQFSDIFEALRTPPPTMASSTAAEPKVALKPPTAKQTAPPTVETVEDAKAAKPTVVPKSAEAEDSQEARPHFGQFKFKRR